MRSLTRSSVWWCVLLLTSSLAVAQHSVQEHKEDAVRHRAMAAAHEGAVTCLESDKPQDLCIKALQCACKGLAIGKHCSMKNGH
jgi:hypothetical protein